MNATFHSHVKYLHKVMIHFLKGEEYNPQLNVESENIFTYCE